MLDSPVATSIFVSNQFIHLYNDAYIPTLGKTRHPNVMGKPAKITAQLWDFIEPLFQRALAGESIHLRDLKVNLDKNGYSEECYIDLSYSPIYLEDGTIAGIHNILVETTDRVKAAQAIKESEAKFRSLIEEAPVATFLLTGPDLVFEVVNESMLAMLGKGKTVFGKSYVEALPELEGTGFVELLQEVYATGTTYEAKGSRADLIKNGVLTVGYYDYTYKALKNLQGQVYAIMCMAVDVTQQIQVQQTLEKRQQELLSSFEDSPVAIAIISRDQLTFRMANPFYGNLVGRNPQELIGKPLLEALPELEGQGFDTLLHGVIATGDPVIATDVPVQIKKNNTLEMIYVNLSYRPRREEDKITGILVVATDVTQQVTARKKIEEAQVALRGAIELANLGTWSMDLKTRILDYDDRLREWFGFTKDEIIDVEKAYAPIAEEDRPLVKKSMLHAVTPGTNSTYDVEYHIHNLVNGSERILHAQGKTLFNENNEAYKVTGTAQDVTAERKIELELKRQVQERTEELAASNEELQAMNEEISRTNEELEEANGNLHRSNSELEQFAYIASHDLQEPVRKISTFTQMLENSLSDVPEKSKKYIEKINTSTERMTVLIRDVLAYSQLSEINEHYERVNLSQILEEIITDFELAIQQKNAVITYSGLPILEAIPLQMSQLFGNLLSNALKYSKAGVVPTIEVSAELLTKEEVAKFSMLDRKKSYYNIRFKDNGIGIKEEQIERIFNIFQRLHSKSEYAGTGIGLSICKKIVQNHHGHIMATSGKDDGTTFNVLLPRHFRKKLR